MKNYQTEQYIGAGLLVGGLTILGTVLGALAGFLLSGGTSEFLSEGWIWVLHGSALGSLVSAGGGLMGLALHIKKQQKNAESQKQPHIVAGLLVGGFIILGTTFGAVIGFLLGGGMSEFLNVGWIWKLSGMGIGSLLSAAFGLIGFAIHVKNNQRISNSY